VAACTRCNLCAAPGTLEQAEESGPVPCNVRRHKENIFTYWRCRTCGSLHCAEDADLAHYYQHYPIKAQQLNFHARIGYRNRLALLEHHGLRQTDRILDYGCGPGLFVRYLRDRGYRNAVGYDPFEPACSDSRLLEETYDAVVSYDVIEHDEDPRRFLFGQLRLLREGGLLCVGTPNADGVSVDRTADPSLHAPYHRHILSERAMLALAGECGAELLHLQRRSYFDSPIPTVNSHFMWKLIEKSGGLLDTAYEPPKIGVVLTSPELIFLAFFGYFFPAGNNTLAIFRNHCKVAKPVPSTQTLAVSAATP
jgi:2-polyprenyl-3-methyl-5-hydroxy-6-metoxy-1,4-benzoquinol methylase